jgi:hypothetical protein
VNAHFNYGILSHEKGRNEEAEEQFKLTFEADPNNSFAHCTYGDFLKNIGKNKEAEEQYKLAREKLALEINQNLDF